LTPQEQRELARRLESVGMQLLWSARDIREAKEEEQIAELMRQAAQVVEKVKL
jgi:hypothetical protein